MRGRTNFQELGSEEQGEGAGERAEYLHGYHGNYGDSFVALITRVIL